MFIITSINIMAFSSNDKNINNKNSEKTDRSRSRVSKNPVLWLENYDEGIPVIRTPKKVESGNITLDAVDMVIYDINNKHVIQKSGQNYESKTVTSISPFSGCQGIEQSDFIPENVIPPDDRVRIEDTTVYPYSSICKLIIYAPNGYVYVGTGFLVGSADGHGYHVLTAGHCVYGPDMGGWAVAIEVVPALDQLASAVNEFGTISFEYDSVGNRLQQTLNGNTATAGGNFFHPIHGSCQTGFLSSLFFCTIFSIHGIYSIKKR